jgi:hypothetical protein
VKLKEKLARDYYQERPVGFGEPTSDFLAGFEAAKRLLIQNECRMRKYELAMDDEWIELPVREIKALGEHEVIP